jgi:uncharacterized YigZ family protein
MLYTCTKESESFLTVKNSKFITHCFSACSENEFQEKLNILKLEHPSANHHCYAYRFGKVTIAERANDDGEPSGSAGLPILNAMKSAALSNCAIVVVRYFGGIKLGTSGLIKSYRLGAQESIENNVLAILELHYFCKVTFPYETTSVVEQIIHREGLKIEDKNFSNYVEMTLSANKPIYQLILSELMRFPECQVKDLGSQ